MPEPSSADDSPLQMPILRRQTVEEEIYLVLRREILEGRLRAGQRLIQDEVAAQLGTSRIPLRGALRRLEAAGLVQTDTKGAYSVSSFGPADIEEIYGLRLLLEPHAAVLALPNIGADVVARLRRCNDAMRKATAEDNVDLWTDLNAQFHITIYEATSQRRLLRIIKSLWFERPTFSPLKTTEQLMASIAGHEQIIEAIVAADADRLETLVRAHIGNGGNTWAAYLAKRG